jgi:hypothetical protein
MPYYLVLTFSDRNQAKAACEQLQAADLALSQIEIIGAGYKKLDEVNVFDPNQVGWIQSIQMLFWIVPLGFISGFGFNDITHLTIWAQGSPLVNHLLGGLMGATAGAMGGFIIGGGAQFLFDPEKKPLARRVKAGKYLLVAQGTELLVRQASRALQGLPADDLQMYESFA